MDGLARRYLLVPGLRSSNIYVLDTGPDPRQPTLVKTIDAEELVREGRLLPPAHPALRPGRGLPHLPGRRRGRRRRARAGSRCSTTSTFDVLRAWETDRGPQHFHYDAWWHLNQNVLISSEWGSPSMIEDGIVPELLLGQKYGHAIHFWDLAAGKHVQRVDLGAAAPDGAGAPPVPRP